jgi:molybdenum cofactor cytidylyltransferase
MSIIWGVILAAGESKRMKMPKLLLLINGKPMIGIVVEEVTRSALDKTLIITGACRNEIKEATKHFPVIECFNDNYKMGMLSSVICGFKSVPAEVDAVVVIQGDQPGVTAEDINLLVGSYKQTKKGIVVPVFMEERGHPVLIDIKYKREIENLNPDEGLRSLLQNFPDDIMEIETKSPGILKDIDTYEDYLNEINQIR